MTRRTVLVLGLPRSGSTWVSTVLGTAAGVVRRHEPITQTLLSRGEDPFAHVAAGAVRPSLAAVADDGFRPPWWPRRLLVKEVAPLLGDWLVDRYDPIVVDLERHPAAIAASHLRLGWRPAARERDRVPGPSGERLRRLWADLAPAERKVAYVGAVREWVRGRPWAAAAVPARYEELRRDPAGTLPALAAGLDLGAVTLDVTGEAPPEGPWSLRRPRRAYPPATATPAAREVWTRFDTGSYDADEDWHPRA